MSLSNNRWQERETSISEKVVPTLYASAEVQAVVSTKQLIEQMTQTIPSTGKMTIDGVAVGLKEGK